MSIWNGVMSNVETKIPYASEAIRGVHNDNELASWFFSKRNIEYIQTAIRQRVFEGTCGKQRIGNQSEDEIKIIMRSTYLSTSLNLSFKISDQIQILNEAVLVFCVKRIIQELATYDKFLVDSQQPWSPMDRPMSTNVAGTKNNEFKRF
jgi:hypothetical protein